MLEDRGPPSSATRTISRVVLPRGPREVLAGPAPRERIDPRRVSDRERWLAATPLPASERSPTRVVWAPGMGGAPGAPFSVRIEIEPRLGGRAVARVLASSARGGPIDAELLVLPLSAGGAGPRDAATPALGGDRTSAHPEETHRLFTTPDGRWLILEVAEDERRSLHPIDVAAARARLLGAEGQRAYSSGDLATATSRFEEATRADPRAGAALYNLACAHALAGDEARAAAELALVISLDPGRFSRLAMRDPDLARIRCRPEVAALLSACARGAE